MSLDIADRSGRNCVWRWKSSNKSHVTHETESPRLVHFKWSHWWKGRAGPSSLQHYTWGTNGVFECKMDVQVYMDALMASNGSRFMVTWIIFKDHLLEVGLTQNWETMALQMLTTVDSFYFIMCEDRHGEKFIELAFGWGPGHIRLHAWGSRGCTIYYVWESHAFMTPPKKPLVYERLYV